ncbi:lipopolysaccharide biosynthesis protein [Methylocystis echinoides]|uniref:LPS biosynthesis protein n=1 Tax=Methylocystis echinoides TaxID=29468 RepID=A0A9W6LTR8_9HYPH|nr:lipopolysaccharide biosynthesis protein [Methylocystis echinoides]GLI94928.1 LPS biosynthesis protein [Methylocystis echinoides]
MPQLLYVLRSFGPFAASVLLSKGLALFTIPIVARRLTPENYGELELIVSFVEISGLVFSFGLADTLFRFASGTSEHAQRRVAAGLVGSSLILAVAANLLLQAAAYWMAPRLGLSHLMWPIAFGLLGAAVSGLIEMPLAWLRLRNRPSRFMLFTVCRSLAQALSIYVTLSLGFGVTGILAGNATIDLLLSILLMIQQTRMTGISFDRETVARTVAYGLPIVGGSLSMFVLGSCDRWFLAGAVPASELGFYGLAAKLSMIVPLAMQPFGLWWYARRIGLLQEDGGLEKSAQLVTIGVVLLGIGVAVVCGAAPIFVSAFLPPAFRGALPYLPWLALIASLNELCSLTNVGAYASRHSFGVLTINSLGAVIALVGYLLFVPSFGVYGAIAATITGQSVRMGLFVHFGRRVAPIPYAWRAFAAVTGIDTLLVYAAHGSASVAWQIFYLFAAGVALSLLLFPPVLALYKPGQREAFA